MGLARRLLLVVFLTTGCATTAPAVRLSSPLCEVRPEGASHAPPNASAGVWLRLPPGFAAEGRRAGHFGVTRWVRSPAEVTVDMNGLSVPRPAACHLVVDGFDASIHEFRAGRRHFVAVDFALHGASLDLLEHGLIPGRMTVYGSSSRRADMAELRAALATLRFSPELKDAVERARAIEDRQREAGGGEPP